MLKTLCLWSGPKEFLPEEPDSREKLFSVWELGAGKAGISSWLPILSPSRMSHPTASIVGVGGGN